MDSVSILFVPWGNPYLWKVTEYILDEGCDVSVKSFTTLPLLLQCLSPTYVVIFALDTLAPYSMNMSKSSGLTYYDVLNFAREAVLSKLRELNIDLNNIHVEILPGTGKYNYLDKSNFIRHGVFNGKITDYKYSLVYFLARYFIDNLVNLDPDICIEIVLDLTHGVNYMPTFTYDVVLTLSRILKYRFRRVSLKVYNPDPFSTPESVHTLNKAVDVKNLAREYMNESMSRAHGRFFTIIDPSYASLVDDVKLGDGFIDVLNIFTGSVINGLPLATLTFFPNTDVITKILDIVIERYASSTRMELENNVLRVNHPIAFNKGVEIVSKIMLITRLISMYVDEPIDGYYSLDSIKKIAQIYDSSTRNHYIIHREIFNMKEAILKKYVDRSGLKKLSGKYPFTITGTYREYLFEGEYSAEDEGGFIRNFLSHAGLEKNITLIKLNFHEDGSIDLLLKYGLDLFLDMKGKKVKVKDLIRKAAAKELIEVRL